MQGRPRRRQAGDRAEARRLRGRPRGGDGAYRRAGRLDRNLRCDLDPRGRGPGARTRRADRNHRMLRPCRHAKGQPARRGVAVRRQARPADRRVLFGRHEFRAAQPGRDRETGKNARPRQHRRQSARCGICRGGRSLGLHAVDPDHDRRSRHRYRDHRRRIAEGAARIARAKSADRRREGGPSQQAGDLYLDDVDRLYRIHQGPAQVAAAYRGHAGARSRGRRHQVADRLRLACARKCRTRYRARARRRARRWKGR